MYKPLLTTASAIAMLMAGAAYAADKEPVVDRTLRGATPSQVTSDAAGQRSATNEGLEMNSNSSVGGLTGNAAAQPGPGAGPRAAADATLKANAATYQSYDKDRAAFTGRVANSLTAEDLIGTDIVDRSGKDVGEISDLLVDSQGNVNHVLVDVGGFLGIGARTVALDLRQLTPEQGAGDALVTSMTEAQLKALPEVHSEGNMWRSSVSGSATTNYETRSGSSSAAPGSATGSAPAGSSN
ncbi:MAG: PRC-barrel domain-containing protein [Alphaproteobacteria bacterium]